MSDTKTQSADEWRAAREAKRKPKPSVFPRPSFNYPEDIKLCPCCESEFLHQQEVMVYERNEDENTVIETHATRGRTTKRRTAGTDNPSPRRQGLRVIYWCEQCETTSAYTSFQHKGNTLEEHVCLSGLSENEVQL
jgi:hypothetical protein